MTKSEWRKHKYEQLRSAGFEQAEARVLRDRGKDLVKFLIGLKESGDVVTLNRVLKTLGCESNGLELSRRVS